jgi:hypothetical protein
MNRSTIAALPPAARHTPWWLAGVAVCGLTLTGCLIIPTPQFHSGNARRNLGPDTPARFEPGKSTRTDVILALGEPDAVSADERRLAYWSEKVAGFLLVGGYGAGAAAPLTKDEYLVCEFDARGRLLKAERSTHWLASAKVEQKVGPSADAGGPAANVHVDTRASWLEGVNDYRTLGFTDAKWTPGHLVVTDSELRFFARSDFGNAPPTLTLPLRTVSTVSEDRIFIGDLLAVRTSNGKCHTFQIWGDHQWTIDRDKQHEVAALLNARIAAVR